MSLDLVRLRRGPAGVEQVLTDAAETPPVEDLTDDAGWSSYDQFRRLLEAIAAVLGDVDALEGLAESADLASGSMPSTTEMLQSLGSPSALFAEVAQGHNGILTFLDGWGEQTGPTEWLMFHRTKPGFEPFPEFCAFSRGLQPLTPRLFGYDVVTVVEEQCQNRGDGHCATRVSWEEVDEASRHTAALEQRLALLERRIETFQDTVSELVLASDLDTALDRVVAAAARAVRAQGFVLTVGPLIGQPARIYSNGLAAPEASRVAGLLSAGQPCAEVGDLVVEIASSQRRYGLLAAYDPSGIVHTDRSLLHAYARLAAAVLDSATALEGARQEAARANVLLDLSAALTDIESMEAMARSLARATPAVLGADRAVVTVADWENDVARVIGCHGYGAAFESTVLGTDIPLRDPVPTEIMYLGPVDTLAVSRRLPPTADAAAVVVVPIVVDGKPEGWLTANVVDRPERLAPTPELEARLHGLAAQASSALRNARLVEQVRHQALHDSLTGLPNRTLILDRADQMLARQRRDGRSVSALFVDLDGFKEINDTLGHAVGDRLLQAVAHRFAETIRDGDTLGRLGGDEFVVLVDDASEAGSIDLLAQRLIDALGPVFLLSGLEHTPLVVTASIGIAVAVDTASAGDLLRDADVALYRAKSAGKNQAIRFATEMRIEVSERRELDTDLRIALAQGQFFLVYQPIFELQDEQVIGVEALIRWQHPTRGVVMPDTFIPALEESGLIVPVGAWVLADACRQAAEWRRAGYQLDISVNMSARQLETDRILDVVRTVLADSGIEPTSLILEITEHAIMRDADTARARMTDLKQLGVRLAIDDFGTGYSSLAYLQQFPVDALKIDRTFVNAIADSNEAGALIHTFVGLGQALGLTTLAEGIEDRQQLERLRDEHCETGQGYLLARPLPPAEITQLIDARRTAPSPNTAR